MGGQRPDSPSCLISSPPKPRTWGQAGVPAPSSLLSHLPPLSCPSCGRGHVSHKTLLAPYQGSPLLTERVGAGTPVVSAQGSDTWCRKIRCSDFGGESNAFGVGEGAQSPVLLLPLDTACSVVSLAGDPLRACGMACGQPAAWPLVAAPILNSGEPRGKTSIAVAAVTACPLGSSEWRIPYSN